MEHCALEASPSGNQLGGVVVLPIDGMPGHVEYRVEADVRWRTRSAEVVIAMAGGRRIALTSDGAGRWTVDGSAAPELDGCLDVDLGFTPSTNTLPIRRLALEIGARADVSAAWVRFPGFTVERLEQSYERLEAARWRYRSSSFEADLLVDDAGLVTMYGDGIWSTAARSDAPG
jgi:hypothetical protein